MDAATLEMLRCPCCRGVLREREGRLACAACDYAGMSVYARKP